MSKQILVNFSHYETRVATLENGEIRSLHIEREEDKNVVGNIYLGVVKRVLPGMQAAFLELGLERTAFLYVDDIIDQPFGGDFDLLEEDSSGGSESESAVELGADDDGEPLKESYDEEIESEGGRQKWERDVTEISLKSSEPAEIPAEGGAPVTEEAEEFFEKSPEERAEELVATTEEDDDEEDDEDEAEGEAEELEDEVDEDDVDADEDDLEEDEDEVEDEQELKSEDSEEITEAVGRETEGSTESSPGENLAVTDKPTAERSEPETPVESENDNVGNRIDSPRANREGSRPRGRNWGRGRRPSSRRDSRNDRGRDSYNVRDRQGRDRDYNRDDEYRAPSDRESSYYREERGQYRRDSHEDRGYGRDNNQGREDSRQYRDRDRSERDRDRDRDKDRGRPYRAQGRGNRDRNDRDRGNRDRNEGGRRSPRRPHHHGGRSRNGRRFQKRRPRGSANIQDLLKEGQEILVQVAKAPIGTKGARLTTHISLPGRNLVLMPTVKHLGISRRIESDRERRRLRDIFTKRLRPKDAGFIIRTVAQGKSFRDLKADAEYLLKTWARIKRDSKKKRAPALIHEDLSLSMRSVRDFFNEEVDSFVIDNAEEHENVLQFIDQFMPQLKGAVKLFKGPSQLFEHYGIEAEISRALGKKVWLKSGGYLLFDQSEALTAIDVNTGRYVGSKSLEETILKTNLEAVKEIAYQLRIRNVGGIIILDLIDMESMENREKVYQALQEALSEDKSRTNILKISELGLVEMTRKRTHEDLIRYLTEACSVCEGRGYHKSRRTVCFEIFREIEKEALSNTKNIVVFAAPSVVARMMNEEKKHVAMLEDRFGKKIAVKQDPAFHVEQYEVFGKH